MVKNLIDTNRVRLAGIITSEGSFSHKIFGEGFYIYDLETNRFSNTSDTLRIMVSDRAIDIVSLTVGTAVKIEGQLRSYNKKGNSKTKVLLNVFVNSLEIQELIEDENLINLYGCICKVPVFRLTPSGREITDVLIAVNRPYGKTDYIPCICWGRNALYAARLEVGTNLSVSGRFQSRVYLKDGKSHITYEVSVSTIQQED